MDMCLGRCDDAQVVGFGEIDVAVNITLRVDDDRLARFLATDEVGGLRELMNMGVSLVALEGLHLLVYTGRLAGQLPLVHRCLILRRD